MSDISDGIRITIGTTCGSVLAMSDEKNNLVTLARVPTIIEAQLMKSKLESEGLMCFVADENLVGIQPLYSGAIGGVRVQVRQKDSEEASRILGFVEPRPMKSVPGCPKCGSNKVTYAKTSGVLNLIAFFLAGVFFRARRSWKCGECQNNWVK